MSVVVCIHVVVHLDVVAVHFIIVCTQVHNTHDVNMNNFKVCLVESCTARYPKLISDLRLFPSSGVFGQVN